jgi:transcriptional regulator with XRE-family HTH domain
MKDREFRRAFAEEAVDVGVPVQIREMRLARGWTQKQLGEVAHVAQESVARAESMSYGRFTLATLKNLAAAFDCALVVRFASFSELIDWKDRIDSAVVTPPDYASDYRLQGPVVAASDTISTGAALDMSNPATMLYKHVKPIGQSPSPILWERQRPAMDRALLIADSTNGAFANA